MKPVMAEINVIEDVWRGLYGESWKGLISDDAFAHPAKFSRALIRKIYDHLIAEGWAVKGSSVVDPFGGVALGGFDAMRLGLNWVGCELEAKFVGLGNQNIALWNERFSRMPNWGTARLIQGDSRKLVEVFSAGKCRVSSPPYAGGCTHTGGDDPKPETLQGGDYHGIGLTVTSPPYANDTVNDRNGIDLSKMQKPGGHNSQSRKMANYGESSGHLGAMKEGDLTLAISSPPYASGEKGHPSLGSVNNDDWGRDGRDITRRRGKTGEYGSTEGQLGAMPEGQLCVSSPPFPQPYTGGGGINVKGYSNEAQRKGSSEKPFDLVGKRTYQSKGGYRTEGNLETLDANGFECAVSSPPYEAQDTGATRRELEKYDRGVDRDQRRYGDLGSGETFWSASRLILEQLHQVTVPGGHATFVVKAFVRDKKIVDFPGQWAQLCEAVGFRLLHHHRASLVERGALQPAMDDFDIQGDTWRMVTRDKDHSVARKSFFRRLAEAKGSPRIDHESVLCFERAD